MNFFCGEKKKMFMSGVGFEPTPPFGDQNARPRVSREGYYP